MPRMSKEFSTDVPSWNGDPSLFLTFETACRWYEKTLKEGERRGAAARVWSKLSGPARSVVRRLSPDEFDVPGGLEKLLAVLRASPLQTLPIPDSFSKLERWHVLRRKEGESIPELIVREADLFHELQLSLLRSRARSDVIEGPFPASSAPTSPPAAATASPSSAKEQAAKESTEEASDLPEPPPEPERAAPLSVPRPSSVGFFEDELRGYRLAAGLNNDQRMQILTLTSNSVAFERVRQALRALFGDLEETGHHRPSRRRGLWWAEEAWPSWADEEAWLVDDAWGHWPWEEAEAYWGSDWGPLWEDWGPEGSHETAEEVADMGTSELAEQEGAEEDALAIQEQDAAFWPPGQPYFGGSEGRDTEGPGFPCL